MRIIHLASGDLWAGAEVQLFHLVTRLAKSTGIRLLVVLLNPGQLATELKKRNVEVYILDESALSGFVIFRQFSAIVRDFQPDIVHTHRNKEHIIGGLAAKFNGCKSVRTVHGASELDHGLFNLRRFVIRVLDKLVASCCQQKIIAVSLELKHRLQTIYPQTKLAVIENGLDLDYIENKSNEICNITIDKQLFNIVFIGRFVPVKRVDLFYAIAKATIAAIPDKALQFHLIGDGPLKSEIEEQVSKDGLTDKIRLHGFVANTAPLLKNMDLLMFTSEHEGLPMTLLEAMALSVPVLSCNLPSIHQVLCDGKCGFVLESEDILDFVDIISAILTDEADAKTRARQARMVLNSRYNITISVEKYLDLYNNIIS